MPVDEKQALIDNILSQIQTPQAPLPQPSKFGQIATGIGSILKRDKDPIAAQNALREHVQAPAIAQNTLRRQNLSDKLKAAQLSEERSTTEALKDPMSEQSKRIQSGFKNFIKGSSKIVGLKDNSADFSFIDQMSGAELGEMKPLDVLKLAVQNQQEKASRLDVQRERDKATSERQHNTMIQKFSTKLTDSGIPQLDDTLTEIEQIIESLPKDKKGAPKDIPAFGRVPSLVPTFMTSGQGKQLRQAIQKLSNVQLKQRSGAAVTQPEFARFVQEFGTGKLESEEALIGGLARLRRAIEADRAELERGLPPEAQQEYVERGGRLNRHKEVSAPKVQSETKVINGVSYRREADGKWYPVGN